MLFFFFQAEDGIRDTSVTGVQTCALPISHEIAHEPHDAIRDPADAGRKDLGGERRARAPETHESETPGEAKDPEAEVARGIDPASVALAPRTPAASLASPE